MDLAAPCHNLPPRDYERFVGRLHELAELQRLLKPRSRAFVITLDLRAKLASQDNALFALDLFRRLGMRQEQAEAEALLRQIGEQP